MFNGALMVIDDELPEMKAPEQIGFMSGWIDVGLKTTGLDLPA